MWRLFLAEFIFQHSTIESLLRECRRNSQLRQLCGLQSHYISMNHSNNHVRIIPSSAVISCFIKNKGISRRIDRDDGDFRKEITRRVTGFW